ncbi:hypothetical protein C2E23DRAFT_801426 [Lenzites betulinus]|nr:hypothetical protein C2E23DRAFT_801426 [Lenzites betulinus]
MMSDDGRPFVRMKREHAENPPAPAGTYEADSDSLMSPESLSMLHRRHKGAQSLGQAPCESRKVCSEIDTIRPVEVMATT